MAARKPPKSAGSEARVVRTADEMAEKQRDISVSEFFVKNRHLLGFDNPLKALLTTVKEGVDNALDACEEAGVLPEVIVEITRVSDLESGAAAAAAAAAAPPATAGTAPAGTAPAAAADKGLFQRTLFDPEGEVSEEEEAAKVAKETQKGKGRKVTDPPEKYVVAIEDNGPGIVREQIGKVFGKLLYGSKFHRLRQSLTADQPVLVERGGRAQWTTIGALVDPLLPDGAELADVTGCRWRVPAFDPATGTYAWRPVSHVIRHPRANEILEVRTECGKSVRVTGCHSLFTVDSATGRVREIAARDLRPGDHVVAPKRLPAAARTTRVRLLEWLDEEALGRRQVFVYGVPGELLAELASGSSDVHLRGADGRSRRHLRFRDATGRALDVLDDSWAQYVARGFLPARVALRLGLASRLDAARLRTYFHGRAVETPATWDLTPDLLRFLGLWTAEGHADRRQAGFTLAAAETDLVTEIVATAASLGLSVRVEPRPRNAVRVKVFGGALDLLLPAWCGRGAHAKHVPPFVFGASRDLRAHFLDGLHLGDGHRVRGRDVLMLCTTSEALVREVETLWLMQGVVASRNGPFRQRRLGREPSVTWRLDVHGRDIDTSHVYASAAVAGRAYSTRELSAMAGDRVTRHLPDHMTALGYFETSGEDYVATERFDDLRRRMDAAERFGRSDLCLLRVREIRPVEDPNPFVYDLSVPGCENFVAGHGGLACHNSRGQQGIGISAAGMYGQLTTGKPVRIYSRTGKKKAAHYMEVALDLQKNQPDVRADREADWDRPQGTRVEIELEAKYQKGQRSVDTYLRATALANPHVTLRYRDPEGTWQVWERATRQLPAEPKEIKPHPDGVELGMLLQMLRVTAEKKLGPFLENEFSRVSHVRASEVCDLAGLNTQTWVARVAREEAAKLHEALGKVKFMDPATDCISPIGEGLLVDSLQREYPKAFLKAVTRAPSVYRGNPFQIEVALAHDPTSIAADQPVTLLRFANRVPLLYQQGACAISKAVTSVPWKSYHVDQSRGALPTGPMVLVVHLASVWVPFTSESKEAVAHYPEILKEIRLGVMECGRSLGVHLARARRQADELKKRDYIARYIPKISEALQKILEFDDAERDRTTAKLTDILNRSRSL